LMYVNRLEI